MFTHLFANSAIHQTEQDQTIAGKLIPAGYVNATAMCKANGKRLANYTRLESSKAYAEAVSADTQVWGFLVFILIDNIARLKVRCIHTRAGKKDDIERIRDCESR